MNEGLKPGRIVYYVSDRRRAELAAAKHVGSPAEGNPAYVGQLLPAMVVAVWSDTCINLKVFLDGPGELWVTSVEFSDEKPYQPHTWHWMYEGQGVAGTVLAQAVRQAQESLGQASSAPEVQS